MAKKVQAMVKLQIPAGKATPAPPVGTALGPHGVNIMDFVKAFNAKTAKDDGLIIPVVAIPVRDVLHLKSGMSALDEETVLWHPAACDRAELDGLRVVEVPGDDPEAANVVRLPDGSILVPRHQEAAGDIVAGHGHEVRLLNVSEFARADGGVTCLSLRLRAVTAVSSPE